MAFLNLSPSSLLGLVITAIVLRALYIAFRPDPLNQVPGPLHARFTNLRLKLAVISGRRVHYIHALHHRYGPYVRISPEEVAVNDIKGFAQIHAVGGAFEKSSWYKKVTDKPRDTLFVMRDNRAHGIRRRLFARGFSKSNIRSHWEGAIRTKIELAVEKIREESQRTGTADLLKWWTLMASDVSSHLMFGESFHTLEQGEENEYIRTLTKALKGNGIGMELPVVRAVGKLLPFQTTKELFRTNAVLEAPSEQAVRNMRSLQSNKNLFANIMAEAEKGEAGFDDEDVKAEASGLFVAGTDTTAVSLTYLIWAVLQRPALRKQVEDEVATLRDDYEEADVEKLSLLSAVIEETLRLYGAAPGALPRVVPSGGRDIGGYYLPQNTIVSTHAYSLHRDPVLFPNPLEFRHERFLEGLLPQAKAAYTPFGAGSRTCIGVHVAYSELRLAAAAFFRRCPGSKVAEDMRDEEMEFENFFLIAPRGHRCEVVVG